MDVIPASCTLYDNLNKSDLGYCAGNRMSKEPAAG